MSERPILMTAESVRAILAGRKTETRRVVRPQPGVVPNWSSASTPMNPLGEAGLLFRNRGGREVVTVREHYAKRYGAWPPEALKLCPHGVPGDRLWVREAFWHDEPFHAECLASVYYVADHEPGWHPYPEQDGIFSRFVRHSPIHMWKWAARIWLEVVGVRVERMRDITDEGVRAEGVEGDIYGEEIGIDPTEDSHSARIYFMELWDRLNGRRKILFQWTDDETGEVHSEWVPANYGWDANPWVWVIRFKRSVKP